MIPSGLMKDFFTEANHRPVSNKQTLIHVSLKEDVLRFTSLLLICYQSLANDGRFRRLQFDVFIAANDKAIIMLQVKIASTNSAFSFHLFQIPAA